MTHGVDGALRAAERALAVEDSPGTWLAYVAAWQRAGCPGRDPRRDPLPGDAVRGGDEVRVVRRAGHEHLYGRYEAVPGGRARRRVVHTQVVVYARARQRPDGALSARRVPRRCSLVWWRRWAREGQVLLMGGERDGSP